MSTKNKVSVKKSVVMKKDVKKVVKEDFSKELHKCDYCGKETERSRFCNIKCLSKFDKKEYLENERLAKQGIAIYYTCDICKQFMNKYYFYNCGSKFCIKDGEFTRFINKFYREYGEVTQYGYDHSMKEGKRSCIDCIVQNKNEKIVDDMINKAKKVTNEVIDEILTSRAPHKDPIKCEYVIHLGTPFWTMERVHIPPKLTEPDYTFYDEINKSKYDNYEADYTASDEVRQARSDEIEKQLLKEAQLADEESEQRKRKLKVVRDIMFNRLGRKY